MIDAKFEAVEKGKPDSSTIYDDLEELLADFGLESDEITSLYNGKSLNKYWAKKHFTISIQEPEI